jgi:hypothetical protein
MVVFKCPDCRTGYKMTIARLSSKQRGYAKCQLCHQTMYSWNFRNAPIFALTETSDGKTSGAQHNFEFGIGASAGAIINPGNRSKAV